MHKKIVILFSTILCLSIFVWGNTSILYKFTFDQASIGTVPAIYTPGADEIAIPGSTIRGCNFGSDSALFLPASWLAPGPFQGGNALKVESGARSEGILIDMPTPLPPGSLTVEYLVKVDVLNPPGNTVGLAYFGDTEWPAPGSYRWMLRIQPDGKLRLNTDKEGSGSYVDTPGTFDTTRWHHVAGVLAYDTSNPANSSITLWVDGAPVGSVPYNASDNVWSLGNNSSGWPFPCNGYTWTIGFNNTATIGDHRGLDGAIDAVAISDEILFPGTFVLPTSAPPLSLSVSTAIISIGGSKSIDASGGQEPYTWSFSTTESKDSTNIGYISATTGSSVTFYATDTGEADLFCTDNAGTTVSAHLTVVPTSAPLFPEPEMKTTIREIPMRVIVPTPRGWELFE
jgi:hypothetical protein